MTDKRHHRQKTLGSHQSSGYNLTMTATSSLPVQQSTKKSYPKKNFQSNSNNKNYDQTGVINKSIFDDPKEESRYLKFLMREKFKIFENDEQNKKRLEVLRVLTELVDKWHVEVSILKKGMIKHEVESRHATILSFGSFKMGVHFPQTDMDLICVFPHYVQQEDFFTNFKAVLTDIPETEEIIDVVDARIPILKLKFMGFQIDLLFAQIDAALLDTKKSIEKLIKDEQIFSNLTLVSQNSFNGLISTLNVIRSVPNPKKFRSTLRLVKLWAMRRGIYSNTFGYLGGVSYAIMVAKVCQEYPDLEMSDLLYKFFEVYTDWKWIDPVSIRIWKKKDKDKLNLNTLQALDAYSQDIMPILTPTTNPRNSAYRVCQHTYYTIIKEFNRAKQIIKEVAPCSAKKMAHSPDQQTDLQNIQEELKGVELTHQESTDKVKTKWSKLFTKMRFFAQYEHFIKIDILSTEECSHQKWLGYVESQLRRLFQLFGDNDQIQDIRIYPRAFKREETKDIINHAFKCCDSFFIGMRFSDTQQGATVNLREQVKDFCNWLEIGRVKKLVNNVRILHFKKCELPSELVDNF